MKEEQYDYDMKRYGLGKKIRSLAPLPFEGGRGERPNTASFSYLQACNQGNMAPWNLVTKFENPMSPTLNLEGLTIGGGFSKCLR